MAKRRSLDDKLARLRSLRGAGHSPEAVAELCAALADASNLVVAEAAEIAEAALAQELVPDLVAAFNRFMEDAERRDKLCRAKSAIAETLNRLEYADEDFWWRGARYVQLEPAWPQAVDTAAGLRVTCAFALVRNHARGVLAYLVDLLTDPEKTARVGAAQALAYSETDAAYLLLRLKARLGDQETDVIAECFNGILKLSPQDGLAFVAEYLNADNAAIQEAAVLALGESRRKEALDILKSFWERNCERRLDETILMALALSRQPAAFDFLLGLIAAGTQPAASGALTALGLHGYDEKVRERVAGAVASSGREELQRLYEKRFAVNE